MKYYSDELPDWTQIIDRQYGTGRKQKMKSIRIGIDRNWFTFFTSYRVHNLAIEI
ncbi:MULTISPECIES: hypothetical protein [unclassified Paenibacillus]|uniref:hypothetical protein n=1 Tax=unclassified Paenibacillus TaxID=185978 RepID=UPI0030F949C1